jgi:hypothetical protein
MQHRRFAMKITALSAILLAGASALVSAAPEDRETTERVSYTSKARRAAPASLEGWIELASPTPASHGREYITVNDQAGPLVRLRISSHRGRVIVQTVRVDFDDGKSRTFRLDKVVTRDKPAYVDLRGPKRVERVVVATERAGRAEYTLHGEVSSGGIARR